ncbi:DUF1129 domain-containing protein [Vagococcus xieshaowenii]|uniref:DUF1129 domain-containing protein n=1 Tax=Vagococcus xieshaowenii TaxID=2562451 RepID=A0AAJ5EFY0_9ENTE|nr:DUF1129 family protein [Vagococcus xieshaowenii]QCA27855.1 DUF1129 domain-containing protein [Vagococcus xieshaowenii]TFZ42432.1 DUF1129 domain-containing protein [Vagococcus xieshaowenii]
MEAQELRALIEKNLELEEKLTKKNQQYIFDLRKAMNGANVSDEKQITALADMLPQLVETQKTGQTARQLFGTVTERLELIANEPVEVKEVGMKEMVIDNSLLLFALLGVMSVVMPMFLNGQPQGILTLIIGSISGGVAFYYLYNKVYQYDRPGADRSQKPGAGKTFAISMLAMLGWSVFFIGSMLIPGSINVVLQPVITLILSVGAYLLRRYLRKKNNIMTNMFSR